MEYFIESAYVRYLRTNWWCVRAANEWDFWYKNNDCTNTVQSTFHVALCFLYSYCNTVSTQYLHLCICNKQWLHMRKVVMNKAARTNAFSFQIINSLIDTWPGLTVTLLICFTTDPIRGVASFSTLCRPGWLSFSHILKIARRTITHWPHQ